MKKVKCIIPKENIAIITPPEFRVALKELYAYADEYNGGYIMATLEPVQKARTTGYKSQNHAINGYIGQIAKETGEDAGVIKMHCKTLAIRRGYPLKEEDDCLVYSKITGEPLPESEANISAKQAGYLIEEIVQLASELGIELEG